MENQNLLGVSVPIGFSQQVNLQDNVASSKECSKGSQSTGILSTAIVSQSKCDIEEQPGTSQQIVSKGSCIPEETSSPSFQEEFDMYLGENQYTYNLINKHKDELLKVIKSNENKIDKEGISCIMKALFHDFILLKNVKNINPVSYMEEIIVQYVYIKTYVKKIFKEKNINDILWNDKLYKCVNIMARCAMFIKLPYMLGKHIFDQYMRIWQSNIDEEKVLEEEQQKEVILMSQDDIGETFFKQFITDYCLQSFIEHDKELKDLFNNLPGETSKNIKDIIVKNISSKLQDNSAYIFCIADDLINKEGCIRHILNNVIELSKEKQDEKELKQTVEALVDIYILAERFNFESLRNNIDKIYEQGFLLANEHKHKILDMIVKSVLNGKIRKNNIPAVITDLHGQISKKFYASW